MKADGKGAVIGERSRERSVIDMLGHWLKMRNTIQERHEEEKNVERKVESSKWRMQRREEKFAVSSCEVVAGGLLSHGKS